MIIKIILVIIIGILGSVVKSYDYTNRSVSVAFYAPIYRKKWNFLILILWVLFFGISIVILFLISIIAGIIGIILYFTIIPRIIDPPMFRWVTGMTEKEYIEKYGYEFNKNKF